ncbi:hypothetical protein [Kingella negevensis]|nr:hypothetical protein [Kingella negevensis]MDK4689401.1 hypothetical protein [Kingella negevensis]WII90455.1 hypothetical protein QEO93_08345 [Kingella negevensis]
MLSFTFERGVVPPHSRFKLLQRNSFRLHERELSAWKADLQQSF